MKLITTHLFINSILAGKQGIILDADLTLDHLFYIYNFYIIPPQ